MCCTWRYIGLISQEKGQSVEVSRKSVVQERDIRFEMNSPFKVVVVGGGIGGLAAVCTSNTFIMLQTIDDLTYVLN